MSKLASLKSQLGRLRCRRLAVRWTVALSGLALAVLWTLVSAFLADWLFAMSPLQRSILLLLGAAGVVWAYRRFSRPLLGYRESELDMARLVEERQGIDSDLTAALQFEDNLSQQDGNQWGSPELETAVVEYVAEFSPDLEVSDGPADERLKRRLSVVAATAALIVGSSALFPDYAGAFMNRLLLGSAHYPTATVIESMKVGGKSIPPFVEEPHKLRIAYGRPVRFQVTCSGELPKSGTVRLRSDEKNIQTEITLRRAQESRNAEETAVFTGEYPKLVDSLSYQLYVGDAWSDPHRIDVVPLPVVSFALDVTPPKYAASGESSGTEQSGSRHIAVPEGSRVDLQVRCANKPLQRVGLQIEDQFHRLVPADESPRRWRLPANDTPLADITERLTFEVHVEDQHGLKPENPLRGSIEIKRDRRPRVAAGIVSRRVLPTAQPRITFGAVDDYGIARVRLRLEILGEDDSQREVDEDLRRIPPAEQPRRVLRDQSVLDLSRFNLSVGQKVEVTVEAVDFRGEREGQSSLSEPMVLEVTDREGILAGLIEADQQSARQLDAIIERELGIGESQ